MNSSKKSQSSNRNKLLHRFYEPLVLLHVLDRIQGDHLPRQRNESSPDQYSHKTELRRRFFESLAYVCDYAKGGDTITAIAVSDCPLTFHVACNIRLSEDNEVVPFLNSLLEKLKMASDSALVNDACVLKECVDFSKKRILTYWRFLQTALRECHKALAKIEDRRRKWIMLFEYHSEAKIKCQVGETIRKVEKELVNQSGNSSDLCTLCSDTRQN
jgi:hypothetical protein